MTQPSRYTDNDVTELAIGALNKLKRYASEGLPACYATALDSMYDFYPDLPWDHRMIESLQIIIDHPDFPTVSQQWLTQFNFDLRADFNEAIAFDKAEYGIA